MNDNYYTKALIQARKIFRTMAQRAGIEWTQQDEGEVDEFVHCLLAAADDKTIDQIHDAIYR